MLKVPLGLPHRRNRRRIIDLFLFHLLFVHDSNFLQPHYRVTNYPLALAVLAALVALLAGLFRVLQRRYRCHALLFHAPRVAKLLERALPPVAQPKVCRIRDHGNVIAI